MSDRLPKRSLLVIRWSNDLNATIEDLNNVLDQFHVKVYEAMPDNPHDQVLVFSNKEMSPEEVQKIYDDSADVVSILSR